MWFDVLLCADRGEELVEDGAHLDIARGRVRLLAAHKLLTLVALSEADRRLVGLDSDLLRLRGRLKGVVACRLSSFAHGVLTLQRAIDQFQRLFGLILSLERAVGPQVGSHLLEA